ncbi:MAG: 3-oxoacyl-ACP synthase III family protein [Kiritimatiellia bacterium]
MISVPAISLARIAVVHGRGETLAELSCRVAGALPPIAYGGVIAATFSNPERFPALSVRVAAALGLPVGTPAFDVQLACSAYPYAVYLAGRLAADSGRPVLVVDGDVQSRLVDHRDHATGAIFSDAVTATVVTADAASAERSAFGFLTRADEALVCGETGPIRMDGFKVFSFVATEVAAFLKTFGSDFDQFAPHQANPYMIRLLAKSLGLTDKLLTINDTLLNPGSCSVAMALAYGARPGRAFIAGFGAGYSAAAGLVRIPADFEGIVL